ncbi:MAG: M20 family metallopeptidase [Halobacteriales archaeon]
MSEVVDLARELIAIPSHEDETAAGDAIEDWLRVHTGAEVGRDDAGNVFATRGGGEGELALVGHHDVVPPAASQLAADGTPVAAVRNGRLYGRGSADMKGALAAMLLAFRDAESPGRLTVASFVGEEVGGVGARHAVERGFAPDRAIVGEGSAGYATPGALDVVVAHRGRRGSTLVATGVACHASTPEAGENAIYRAIEAVGRLRALDPPSATVAGDRLHGSLEATRIEAGTADNVVPDRCEVTLDERTVPGAHQDVAGAIADLDGVEWRVDQDWPPMACEDDGFAATVKQALSTTQGVEVAGVTKPHATDASWLARAGSATVVVGPAERDEAHTDDESVSVELLEAARRGYQAAVEADDRRND